MWLLFQCEVKWSRERNEEEIHVSTVFQVWSHSVTLTTTTVSLSSSPANCVILFMNSSSSKLINRWRELVSIWGAWQKETTPTERSSKEKPRGSESVEAQRSACCEVMEGTQTLPTLCTLINFTPSLLDETLLGCFIHSHYFPDMKIQSLGGFQRLSRVHHFS